MNIVTRRESDLFVLELSGRLTINDEPGQLKKAASAAVAEGARSLLLDLAAVHYIDSTRLGELISAHITVRRQGGRLLLIRTPQRVLELLKLAGLSGIFETCDSFEAAKAALGQP